MILRYWYLLRSSWPRLLELAYWPTVQMLTWGFLQLYLVQNAGFFARAAGTFIGAVLLWDIMFRGQLGFSISFLEEMWSRNLANLMISPLKPIEFILAMMAMSLVRLFIGMVPVTLLALGFFGFNLYGMGFALAAFFLNLILTSWSVGVFVSGVVMRNGLGAENLAWTRDVPANAAELRLLSGRGAAALASNRRVVAAPDLCIRRHACIADRSPVPGRPHDRGVRHERRPVCRRCNRLHAAAELGAP
jgi:hypothetical protein